jgi:wyosine [tRNA(Phe)-imidazoG37] synthetase (radical SAM superfamily)
MLEVQMHDVCRPLRWRTSVRGYALMLLQTTIDEFARSTIAAQRYEALRCLGPNRVAVCRRIFAEYYAIARSSTMERASRP